LPLPGRIQRVTLTDRNGHVTLFDYDPRGNLVTVTRGSGALNLITRYGHDAMGRRTSRTIERGDRSTVTTWTYDDAGRLTATVVDPDEGGLGLTETLILDDYGNVTHVINPRGISTGYAYDHRNRLTGRTEAEGSLALVTSWVLDGNGNVTELTAADQGVTRLDYNEQNHLISSEDAEGYETLFGRDETGNLTLVDRGLNPGPGGSRAITTHGYDALGRLTSRTVAPGDLNLVTTIDYGAPSGCNCAATPGRGLPHKITDPAGKVTYRGYDKLDRLTRVVRKVGDTADNGGDANDAVTHYEYDPEGNLTAMLGPAGERAEFEYDAADRRTTIRAIDLLHGNLATTLSYNGADRVTGATLPNGNVLTLVYDGANRLDTVTDLIGLAADYGYDENGNVVTRADGLGRTWTSVYDDADRLEELHDPLAETPTDLITRYVHDGVGRVTETVNPHGVRTHFAYDLLGRLTTTQEDYQGLPGQGTENTTTTYTYDGRGRVKSLADHDGNTTAYAYDAAGRLSKAIYPDNDANSNGIARFTRYPSGRVHTRTDQKGVVTTYTYDDLHRLTGRAYSTGGSDSFGYDRSGRLISADGNAAARSWGYDALGRLRTSDLFVVGMQAWTYTTFDYQIDANVSRRTIHYPYPGGRVVTEDYDQRGRLAGVGSDRDFPAGIVAGWTYDLADQRETASLGNGIASTFGYDLDGRLTSLRHAKDAVDLFRVEYGWDAAGDRTYTRDGGDSTRSEVYTHDARHRLRDFTRGTLNAEGTAITVPAPSAYLPQRQNWPFNGPYSGPNTLDRRGNWRETLTTVAGETFQDLRSVNAVNEVVDRDPDGLGDLPLTALTHDNNGSLTLDPLARNAGDGSVPSGQRYEYDVENRLTRVWNTQGTETPADDFVALESAYDALGGRVKSTSADGTVTYHVSAGWPGPAAAVLEERETNGTLDGRVLREFLYGRDFLEPAALVDHTAAGQLPAATPEPLYYLQDVMRSVVALTDAAGQVVERYAYDAYGTTHITDQSAFRNR
jgi:YD repeat-containing protein